MTETAPVEGRAAHRPPPLVTIVVPTFNERDNVLPLLQRLAPVVVGLPVEVLFVDDSTDDTPAVIQTAASATSVPVRLLHRLPAQRVGGLGGAVLAGLRSTAAEWVLVMDGDLQHPPELVQHMFRQAVAERADVVVASRYLDGGSAGGLASGSRRRVSRAAAGLARLMFPRRLEACSDPMSGFFLVRRRAVPIDVLRPDGFKILLEILARSSGVRVSEVPFAFGHRHAGHSKADVKQGLVYVRHLLRLRTGGMPARLAGFLAIGATGTVPNLVTMALLGAVGVNYLLATALATIVAATSNFLLTDALLFRGRASRPKRERWAGYLGLSAIDIVLRIPLMALLVEGLGLRILVATVVSIVLAGVLRFLVVDRWLYRADAARADGVPSQGLPPQGPPAHPGVQQPVPAASHGHRLLKEAILYVA